MINTSSSTGHQFIESKECDDGSMTSADAPTESGRLDAQFSSKNVKVDHGCQAKTPSCISPENNDKKEEI